MPKHLVHRLNNILYSSYKNLKYNDYNICLKVTQKVVINTGVVKTI